ncbi:MAG: SUMF1/EgtB/PvdO family nonheme iron enzyme [Pseudomonadota bacterium]
MPVRLRWCPPGRFLIGSPEDEEGRWDGEGPQVEITFSDGLWMMETSVTQALWRAVMGVASARSSANGGLRRCSSASSSANRPESSARASVGKYLNFLDNTPVDNEPIASAV